jgi:hypothetical protein
MVMLKDRIRDEQTGDIVEINDLSKGIYDVAVDIAPHFQNRQQETVKAITEIAPFDPSIIQNGADVMLKNITAPGMDILAERKRAQMVAAGIIPESQLTDDEKAQLQAQAEAQANAQPPLSAVEQALIAESQANIEATQARAALDQTRAAETASKIEERLIKLQQSGEQMQLDQANKEADRALEQQKFMANMEEMMVSMLNTNADTMKTIREASGVDAIMGPGIVENFKTQSDIVTESQQDSGNAPVVRR